MSRSMPVMFFAFLLIACERTQGDSKDAVSAASVVDSTATHLLVLVGSRRVLGSAASDSTCSDLPYWGEFVLREPRWILRDSLVVDCAAQNARGTPSAFQTGGHFVLRDSMLELFSDNPAEGVNGLVMRGQVRGDTVELLGSETPAGHLHFVRKNF